MTYTNMAKSKKKFKAVEKGLVDTPHGDIKNLEWEGEEIGAESTTKIEQDKGTGAPIILRFFDFGADPSVFKKHKPTAQELFNSHIKGMESLLWGDGLAPYYQVEPRLMFSKSGGHYRFILACVPKEALVDDTRTLSQLLTNTKN